MFKLGNSSKMVKLADFLGVHKNEVASVDLPAGHTCPQADKCKSFADRDTGKITDGRACEFRCYAASSEAAFVNTRLLRWNNLDLLRVAKTSGAMVDVIAPSLHDKLKVVRVHSSGDFFSDAYFQAWMSVAENFPHIFFFAYTKVLPYLKVNRPDNFDMVYSYGGKLDDLVTTEPVAYVVRSKQEAKKLRVPVSCINHPADDYKYVKAGKSFALLLHGTQPKKKAAGIV